MTAFLLSFALNVVVKVVQKSISTNNTEQSK